MSVKRSIPGPRVRQTKQQVFDEIRAKREARRQAAEEQKATDAIAEVNERLERIEHALGIAPEPIEDENADRLLETNAPKRGAAGIVDSEGQPVPDSLPEPPAD